MDTLDNVYEEISYIAQSNGMLAEYCDREEVTYYFISSDAKSLLGYYRAFGGNSPVYTD